MLGHWRRILAMAAVCPLALLLTGCDVAGNVDVRSGTEVVADLLFTNAAVDCLGLSQFAGLTIKGTPDPDGNQRCRAQGTLDLEELKQFGIRVAQTGEYLTVDIALPQSLAYTPIEVDIRFPGPVTDPGATVVSGNQVRLKTGTGIAGTSPTRIVAMSHTGPEWWIDAAVAGFLAGVALTFAGVGVFLFRRRRRAGGAATADGQETDESGPGVEQADVAQEPSAQAATGFRKDRTPVRDASYEALFAPPTTPDGAAPAPPTTPNGAASAPVPDPPTVPVPDVPAADHSIWGPPEERGDR